MQAAYLVTGLMSGSSLDGCDLASVRLQLDHGRWIYAFGPTETHAYPEELLKRLRLAHACSDAEAASLDLQLGAHFASLLNRFHREHGLKPDLVASHGHTLFHRPHERRTFQAGNGPLMARLTGLPVVANFREADVKAGGQGAPLVPMGDRLLFGRYQACLNLGGFANISFEDGQGMRRAWDTGPANLVLNHLARRKGLAFDKEGALAARGKVSQALLVRMNELDYYRLSGPKSLGKEWFHAAFLPLLETGSVSEEDLLATSCRHIAWHVAGAVNKIRPKRVLVSGGGALNLHLMNELQLLMGPLFQVPDLQLVQYKEALVFALLGVLRWRGEVNCLSSVTGGPRDLCCGELHEANQYQSDEKF